MNVQPIIPGLYGVRYPIPTGSVNAFIIASADGLTLIDTGYRDHGTRMLNAIRGIGRHAADVRHIVITHCHVDHAGSAAALKAETGATVVMHPLDAALVRRGIALRPETGGTSGRMHQLIFALGNRVLPRMVAPVEVVLEVDDGAVLPIAGGLEVIHVPGHSAGQIALLWRQRSVLFAADAVANLFGAVRYPPAGEDLAATQRSIARLSGYRFEVACFGHGPAIVGGASARFHRRWSRSHAHVEAKL